MQQRVNVTGVQVKRAAGTQQECCVSLKVGILQSWKQKDYGTLFSASQPTLGKYFG